MLDIEQLYREEIRKHLQSVDCKSVYTGSIPVLASTSPSSKYRLRESVFRRNAPEAPLRTLVLPAHRPAFP